MKPEIKVKRRISENVKISVFKVIGLAWLKPNIDTFSGSINYETICEVGNIHNPLNFLNFYNAAQEISA
ncbi:hypothetical protein ABEV55_13740 [Aneurinibacillus thermoaerophilus]|uniref:hypothetical protein n=1 Tax=Aneurinibacillus thermoaerophilus TaxID=143495 RepID=UPI002E20036D|nr:hypothetical protein [Aneurinibacillus thermoaerophilus]